MKWWWWEGRDREEEVFVTIFERAIKIVASRFLFPYTLGTPTECHHEISMVCKKG